MSDTIPEEIHSKISEWLKPYFPDIPTEGIDSTGLKIRNEIQRHKRNCLKKGAIFGYSLAQEEIKVLEQTIVDQDNQIVENRKEIERLTGLIKKAFSTFHFRGFPHNEPTWEQFKQQNNLS